MHKCCLERRNNNKYRVKPKTNGAQDSLWFITFDNAQGNIAKWRKKEGDKVSAGDILCEIETVHELSCDMFDGLWRGSILSDCYRVGNN